MHEVSIVLTIFNNSKFLINCLNSILKQSYPPKEIILIDDGSEDDETKKIFVKFRSKTKINFRFYKIKNKGSSGARNFGYKKIKGKYFCFFDPDDYMSKNFIKNRLNIFSKYSHKKIIGVYSNVKTDKNYNINFKKGLGDFQDIDSIGHFGGISGYLQSYLFFKPLIPKKFTLDEKILINEDFDYIIRLLYKKLEVFGISNHDLFINLHEYSLTRSIKNRQIVYANQKKFIKKAIKNKYFSHNEVIKRKRYIESLMARSYLKQFKFFYFLKYFFRYLSI